ncbi:MAG: hypothetical protein JRE45_18830 [Deltaproteobacteria bacterium]|nr:hypothetical protein [Deltaproteobacteria bacterium]
MSEQVRVGSRAKAFLIAAGVGGFVYMFMPSCAIFLADEDDTLCHALAVAEDGVVEWPVDERWHSDPLGGCHVFDQVMMNPWCLSQDAQDYIGGFGIAQGHDWGDFESSEVATYEQEGSEVDEPLGRTYNGYANLVFANVEGIELDRGRSLDDFEYYDTFLKWSSAFVSQKTYRVNGSCVRNCQTIGSYSCTIARTVTGPFRNDYIDLYQTFYYDIDAVWRASTIMHEVRHARDQVRHFGGSGCPRAGPLAIGGGPTPEPTRTRCCGSRRTTGRPKTTSSSLPRGGLGRRRSSRRCATPRLTIRSAGT